MKKALCLLLAALMMTALVSCGAAADAGSPAVTAAETGGNADAETMGETEVTRAPLDLPDMDYGGYVFTFLSQPDTRVYVINDFLVEDKFNGEPINDAIYERNLKVGEKYGVEISVVTTTGVTGDARKAITAGDDAYDVVMPRLDQTVQLSGEGLLTDLLSLSLLDVTNEWWDQSLRESLTIGGKLYASTGDISMMDEQTGMCMMLSNTVMENYKLDNIYEIVKDGRWTLETCAAVAAQVTRDLNGDGVIDHSDLNGLGSDVNQAPLYYGCAGGTIAERSGGSIRISAGDERNIAIADTVAAMLNAPNVLLPAGRHPDSWNGLTNNFIDGRLLLRQGNLYNLKALRDMADDFGVIPFPKYEESGEYRNLLEADECWGFAIPVTAADVERTEIILEALAYHSDALMEAYYDLTLKTKTARDETSRDMLDIIVGTKTYDLGDIFKWGNVASAITAAAKNSDGFAAEFAKVQSKAESELEKFLDSAA